MQLVHTVCLKYDGVCSPVYIVLDAIDDLIEKAVRSERYLRISLFRSILATFGNTVILEHRAAIGWDDIKDAYVVLPTKQEQVAILNFLDHENRQKSDTLIEEQQSLIRLLKEKTTGGDQSCRHQRFETLMHR